MMNKKIKKYMQAQLLKMKLAFFKSPIEPLKESLNTREPMPITNDSRPTYELVIEDIRERSEEGLKKYGTYLQPNNGRKNLKDAYQEAVDLSLYLRNELREQEEQLKQGEGCDLYYWERCPSCRGAGCKICDWLGLIPPPPKEPDPPEMDYIKKKDTHESKLLEISIGGLTFLIIAGLATISFWVGYFIGQGKVF